MYRRLLAAALICLLFLALTALGASTAAPGDLRVSFINVGQGNSALLQDANGFDVLIDGGPIPAGATVVDYLHQAGIDDIDILVASHADSDHFGGLIAVLEATDIPVEAVIVNGYTSTSQAWANFVAAVSARGLTPTVAQFPQTYQWGEMAVHVLNPVSGLSGTDTNAASLVLRLDHGAVSFLFTGDLESPGESQVMARGTPVAAQVLKVGHHGSDISSSATFLQAVAPQQSIISVGRNNSYGHPSADTITRLEAVNAQIWRTDRNGTILVISDGFAVTVVPETVLSEYFLPLIVRLAPTGTVVPGTGKVAIQSVFANGSGAKEADEYVVIKNIDTHAVNLQSWTLADQAGHTYTFPLYTILPSQVCRVYTNEVIPGWCSFSYGSDAPIWNNTGDCASLRNSSGLQVSSYCY